MRYLVATDSASTTRAACQYLQGRITTGDEVLVLAVAESSQDVDTDAALDAAPTQLGDASVECLQRQGTPEQHVRTLVAERAIDELLIGLRRPGTTGLGGTASTLLVETTVPVVVLPND